jgi:hypothetical protein
MNGLVKSGAPPVGALAVCIAEASCKLEELVPRTVPEADKEIAAGTQPAEAG